VSVELGLTLSAQGLIEAFCCRPSNIFVAFAPGLRNYPDCFFPSTPYAVDCLATSLYQFSPVLNFQSDEFFGLD
jgi:hypothetical protein